MDTPPQPRPVRPLRAGSGVHAPALAEVVARPPTALLKAEGSARVWRAEGPDGPVVVKSIPIRGAWGSARARLGLSRAHRQWRGHALLAGLGVATGSPLLLAEARGGAGGPTLLLVLRFVPGVPMIDLLAGGALSASRELALARALGEQIAALARARVLNRDHKLSNLIALPGDEGVAVIDAVGVSRRAWASPVTLAGRMLFSAAVEGYGIGRPPRRTLRVAAASACARALGCDPRRLLTLASARLARHGDARPKVSPLTREVRAGS